MAERRERLEELFYAALERQPDERASFLSEACAADPDLKAEVESLISAHERPGSFLDSPAVPIAAEVLADMEARFQAGQSIGHYEVLARVGRGGMGEVYLARDTRLDRKVALKLLPRHYTADEIRLRRFILEARAASSLNHPNILTIHEIGQADEARFIATEFIVGQTLRQCMAGQPMVLHDALDIAIQVAGALAVAHEAGIVHRDIKPENIMVRPDGYVKVLDFGLAKLAEQQRPAPDSKDTTAIKVDTDPGTVMGTTRYMSPEQARGLEVDARSDIFSLGVVIYEMIAGRPPFTGDTRADVSAAILKTEPAPLADFAPDTPAELQRIVNRALSKEKEQRYQTSDELLSDLKALKRELESASKPVAPSPRWIFYLRLALMILLAAALVGTAWWMITRTGRLGLQPETDWLSDLQLVPLVDWKSEPGENTVGGSLSPDGSIVAYYANQGGHIHIWVKPISGGDPVQLTQDEWSYWTPVWSPDGQQIAVASNRGGQIGVWLIPIFGGAPMPLKMLDLPFYPELTRWSKNGATIYYEWRGNLFALDVASKVITQVTNFDLSTSLAGQFATSPGEDRIAYTAKKDGQWDIWVAPMGGGPAVQVTNDPAMDIHPAWHSDGRRIIYGSERNDAFQVCLAYLDGRRPLQITRGDDSSFALGVSADGARVLYISSKEESDLWGVEVDTKEEFEITSALGMELWPDISPDHKTIAFQATRGSSLGAGISYCSILTRPIDAGGQQAQLASKGYSPKWSPDGSKLAFLRGEGFLRNLWTVHATGGDERQLTTRGVYSGGHSVFPYNRLSTDYSWSNDGSKIVYCSARSGPSNVWAISADGSGEAQISSNTDPNLLLSHPLWSPDDSRIVYRATTKPAGGENVWSVWLIEQGRSEMIFQADAALRPLGWSPSGNEIVVALAEEKGDKRQPAGMKLLRISADGRGRRAIARLESVYSANTQLSPDGRRVAFVSRRDGSDDIWVMLATGGAAMKLTQNIDPKLCFSSLAWSPDGKAIYYGKQLRSSYISMIDNFK